MKHRKQDLAETIRASFERSGMSILRLSKLSKVPYSVAHRFVNRASDVRTCTATRLCRALGLELRAAGKQRRPNL